MTTFKTNKSNPAIALGIIFLIFLSCLLITFTARFKSHNELLSNAILADLLITAPLVYFFAIRKTNVSKTTVIRVIMAGIFFASLILRSQSNHFLQIIKTFVSPAIELLVIFFVCRKFYAAHKIAKAQQKKADFLVHCRNVMGLVCGNKKIGNILSSEIAVIYYALLSRKDRSVDYQTRFSSYKENGIIVVLISILSIFLVETAGMHFIFSLWNKTLAWILTGLSLYTCLQLFAHIKAIRARPVIINDDSFEIHNGLAGDAYIDFENIEKIELSTKKPAGKKSVKISLLQGLENHNVIVHLKKPVEATKIFGIIKYTDTLLFFVDNPIIFADIINGRLININCYAGGML